MVKGSSSSSSKSDSKKQYKGVRMRSWGSWVSEIRAPNQKTRIWLGSYSTPEAAARAYDAALLCLKGSSAALNFPDSSVNNDISVHSIPSILSPKSIQRLAAAAANANAVAAAPPIEEESSTGSSSSYCCISSPTTTETGSSSVDESTAPMSWFDDLGAFQSPKCVDMLNNYSFFAQQQEVEDQFVDISLWSFC